MKSMLILVAALGLSASAAYADCAGHSAEAKIDTTTVASIAGDEDKSVAAPTSAGADEKAPMTVRPDAKDAD